jgi:hypothetical protein
MQSVIKLTVIKFEGRFCRDRFRRSSAFSPFMEVIGIYKNSGLTYEMSVLWGTRYAGS